MSTLETEGKEEKKALRICANFYQLMKEPPIFFWGLSIKDPSPAQPVQNALGTEFAEIDAKGIEAMKGVLLRDRFQLKQGVWAFIPGIAW
jgi:hypothetical protein